MPRPAAGKTALRIFLVGHHATECYHAATVAPEPRVLSCPAMLDLRYVVENREAVLAMLASRGQSLEDVQAFPGLAGVDPWALDTERRALIQEVEQLRHRQRLAGEEIARRGKAKEDASDLKAEMKGVADRIKAGRGPARGGEGGARALPARGAERARRRACPWARTPRPTSRSGAWASRGPSTSRRSRTGTSAPSSASSTSSAPPGSRARASPSTGAGGAARARAHPVHARPARLAGLPRGDPALPRHRARRSPAPASCPSSRTTSSRPPPATATST